MTIPWADNLSAIQNTQVKANQSCNGTDKVSGISSTGSLVCGTPLGYTLTLMNIGANTPANGSSYFFGGDVIDTTTRTSMRENPGSQSGNDQADFRAAERSGGECGIGGERDSQRLRQFELELLWFCGSHVQRWIEYRFGCDPEPASGGGRSDRHSHPNTDLGDEADERAVVRDGVYRVESAVSSQFSVNSKTAAVENAAAVFVSVRVWQSKKNCSKRD